MTEIYEYQELLCKKERLEAEIANLGSESDLLTIRRDFQRERKRLEVIKEGIHDLSSDKKEKIRTIEEIEKQGKALEKQIYDGSVTNPRELESLQDRDKELQNKAAVAQEQKEATDKAMVAATQEGEKSTAALKKLKADFDSSQQELKDAHAQLEAQVLECEKELTRLSKKIKKKVLTNFLENRHLNGGRLYALLKPGGSCSICHRTLTKATLNRLNNGKEAYCDHCNRQLLAPEN